MTRARDHLAALRALNKRFIHNFVTNDVRSHHGILHPEFTAISPSGAHQDRASYLHDWATGFDPDVILYWDMRDERITVVGDVALVRATNKWLRRIDGTSRPGMTCYTDTYIRVSDVWLCIQAQLTPVAPQNYPNDNTVVCQYHRGMQVAPRSTFSEA
jgi:hypothetical protein